MDYINIDDIIYIYIFIYVYNIYNIYNMMLFLLFLCNCCYHVCFVLYAYLICTMT